MRPVLATAVVIVLATVAGCGLGPSPSASLAGSTVPSASNVATTASPTASPLGASGLPDTTQADPSLISAVLGASQPGLSFQYDAETTANVAGDPGLTKDASSLGIGLYTVAGQNPVQDYAIVSVLRLRDPGAADDEWFRAYRDSYDESACAQAGGVARHAQTEIERHTVFIGSCAGGAFTYHLRTKTDDLVVSITGVGPGKLGERLAGAVSDP
jgi:hypothetical protein